MEFPQVLASFKDNCFSTAKMKGCLLIIAVMLLSFSVQCNGIPVDAELELANQASCETL